MNPAHWNRVSDLFANAMELDTARRSKLLEAEDESVRIQVERLLSEHRRSGVLDRAILRTPTLEEDQWTGKTLNGRYRIERFLARGGAGAVYLARDEQIAGRAVVVKFLQTYARHDAWLKHKFHQEMEALARIDHHGVVGILDAGETADGLPFLVIEYIDGVTLRSELQNAPLEVHRVARLMRDVGRAVSAAHEKGVLHRDLKPENIMLERAGTADESVRLIDFGIARVDHPDQETLTHTTRFAGTTMYMAPEQLAGRAEPASDVYAMGVLAYEMLSGQRPFVAASPVELYQLQRGGPKSDLRAFRPEVPAAAARAILKQLSFRPPERSPSALEAGERIADALEGKLREEWSRRQFGAVLASGVSAAAATGAYVWSRSRPLDPAERIIQLPMGTEPLERGFQKSLDIDYHVLPNEDASGFNSMRVATSDQGAYFHPFSAAQAREAFAKGWKMTIEAAVEEGSVHATVDNPRARARYSIALVRNPNQTDSVQCLLVVTPKIQGIDHVLAGPPGRRHKLVLTWTPSSEAEAWVDGARVISGYKGNPEFRYARGLEFATSRRFSRRGAGTFWNIRLEIG
jgi:serine/threonine protein kinase